MSSIIPNSAGAVISSASDGYVFDLGFEAGKHDAAERARLALVADAAATLDPYEQGRIDALNGALDVRYRALAGIERLEEMDLDELDALIEIATGVAYTKRTHRPTLRLVTPIATGQAESE